MNNGQEVSAEAYNGPGRLAGVGSVGTGWSQEQQKKWEQENERRNIGSRAATSLRRVADILDRLNQNQTDDGLFKFDLDNAIRHSVQTTKHLRAIKASLYATEKPTVPGTATPTQQSLT